MDYLDLLFSFQYWKEAGSIASLILFLASAVLNLLNRKIKDAVFFNLREIEITSNDLMKKIEMQTASIDHCYEALHAQRSLAAAALRMIVPTELTREQYERGLLFRSMLQCYRICLDIKSGAKKLWRT